MRSKSKIFLIIHILFVSFASLNAQKNVPSPFPPVPNERQMKYLSEPLAGFIHFGMNTFAGEDGIEWGNDMKRPAATFNPLTRKVDTDQWVRLFKEAGFTRIIMTMKHHDGFCLWPTKVTDYNISNSPYQNGGGDLARELSESCDKYGMDMGIYLSPWDAWEPSYGDNTPGDYNDFYDAQLRELLGGKYGRMNPATGKREIVEIWLDGATGKANPQTYDLNRFHSTVRELQPDCLVWMDGKWHFDQKGVRTNFNIDAMWVGNEAGYIDDPAWNKIDLSQLNNGQRGRSATGDIFCVSEADVSIRPGWFYHAKQDVAVKTLDYLMENIYFRSVGMGIPLLLNIPPNREGKIHPIDSAILSNFGKTVHKTFSANLITTKCKVKTSDVRSSKFKGKKAIDGKYDTYWTLKKGQNTGAITIDLGKIKEFDIVKIQEYIPLGQRVGGFEIEVWTHGEWKLFGKGQTVGYQRIVKGDLVKSNKIRVKITDSQATPLINNIAVYKYSQVSPETTETSKSGGIFEFSIENAVIQKRDDYFVFEVLRQGNTDAEEEITVITTPGTGVHGKTYEDTTETLSFKRGETVKKARVKIINYKPDEGEKNFVIRLTSPSKGAAVGKRNAITVVVKDNL